MLDILVKRKKINKVIKELTPGGQKNVYLVETDQCTCILKIMKANGQDKRAIREIEILMNNDFYNVPKIYETFSVDKGSESRICILEEYIDGTSLRDLLRERQLSKDESLKLLESLLRVVKDLEKKSIVHRDIKPDNILVSSSGEIHLIDFGIARILNQTDLTIVNAEMCPHTPGYGAPELIKNDRGVIDVRADLYSIGIVVYESIVGNHPFLIGGENREEVYFKTLAEPAKKVKIDWDSDGYLLEFLEMLMEKIVTKRPNSASRAYGYYEAISSSLI